MYQELLIAKYNHYLFSTIDFIGLFFPPSFLIYARHIPITVTFFTFICVVLVFLFPIWPWFPMLLMYRASFPCFVNIDFSFSWALSSPQAISYIFHRFIYRTLQNYISNSLVISLLFSEIVGTSLTLPLHCELGFHPRWSWMAHHPPLTSSMTSQYHFTTHSCGHSLQLLMNWKHSAFRMTNLNILCCDQSFLFFQFFLELYSHHNFSKASLDL